MTASLPPSRSSLGVALSWKPPPRFMSSRRAETGGSIRLVLAGELDLAAREHFATELEKAQEHSIRVLLDLRALAFIDCACIATLFTAARRARREHTVLVLLGPLGQVRRLLDLVGSPPGVAVLDHADLPERRAPVAA